MKTHAPLCRAVDKPIAGLIQDLKQRGLLDSTVVVFTSEFGRTPWSQNTMLFRWFIGMNRDEPVWDVTVFTKNRNRLLEGDVVREFLAEVLLCEPTIEISPQEKTSVENVEKLLQRQIK